MNYLNYLTLIPLLIGLAACFRHRKLSSAMPLLTTGLGLLVFSALSNVVWMFFMTHYLQFSNAPLPPWVWLYSALVSLINVGGWTMLAAGLGLVLKDVSEKLAFWEEASQNEWRFGADGIRLQENETGGTEGLEDLLQEEIHRSAFLAPAAQSYNFQPYPTARAAQPEVIVPLGSSNL